MRNDRAFTLIELLVVVAIIMTLLAILLPSMGRARYVATLVTCGSNQRQIAVGASTYAAENRAFYPYRPAVGINGGFPVADALKFGDGSDPIKHYDNRPELASIPLDDLHCPFQPDIPRTTSNASVIVDYTYRLYFGWQLAPGTLQASKIGGRMSYEEAEFDVIVADLDLTREGYGGDFQVSNGHPDQPQLMRLSIQDSSTGTRSRYIRWPEIERGRVDNNYARSDGSVFLVENIATADPRLERVPQKWNVAVSQGAWSLLPAAN